MPVYEYLCQKCEKPFEVLVRSEGEKIFCPSCRSRKIRKLISVFGVGLGAPADRGCGRQACETGKPV
ncbi:MAG: zinc ribbon domain-containing protein [Planctomycetes bacterium]|nr:zinc ribbon domain-containing protein [Planctomycetota bacterium]